MNNDIEITTARNSLSNYCINICQAKCCRRGQLLLELKESLEIYPHAKADDQGYVRVPLENGCPKLDTNFSCTIYEKRPRTCREYPLYPKGKLLLVATSCEGVQKGKLDKHLQLLKKQGYQIKYI